MAGNLIGTNAAGTGAVPNDGPGIVTTNGSGLTIGGTAAGAGNVIFLGNDGDGIDIDLDIGDVVVGNKIGTDITGTLALGNTGSGFVISGGANNTIGGTAAGAGNLISGNLAVGVGIINSPLNVVQGNLIGTDVTGTAALGNTGGGIFVSSAGGGPSSGQNLIGGFDRRRGQRHLGNGQEGIFIAYGILDIVAGNLIGTDASGTVALPNDGAGIVTTNGSGLTIGGTAAGAGNVISGNDGDGIDIDLDIGDLVVGNKIGTDITGTLA